MGKAVIFVRVSTEKQQLESQEVALRQCALTDGFDASDIIYIGKKESGYKLEEDEREGLEELHELVAKNEIDTVYIWELSRLSRKPKILYSVRDKLFENRIQLKCLNPQFTLLDSARTKYDNTANIIFSLFGALAEQEVIEKKERFARGKKRLADEGRYNGGAIPYGYSVDKERGNLIMVNEEEASTVREIFDLYENGFSTTQIAKEFYARGNKRITISFVHQILTNIHLTGIKVKNKNASYERKYPQIISSEQFNRCRDIALKNNTTVSKTRNVYYADRLIKCTTCGSHWSSSGSKVCYHCYDAYNVNKQYNGYDGIPRCQNKLSISINVMDSLLWHLSKMLESQYILNSAQNDLDNLKQKQDILKGKLNNISVLLKDIEEKKDKLREMYIDGLSKERYEAKKKLLDTEVSDVRKKEVEYNKELQHIKVLINNIIYSYKLKDDTEKIDLITNNVISIIEQLDNINDDKIRYDIIHRHINKVTIENVEIKHKFKSYDELRNTSARLISIDSYLNGIYYYIYIPNEGIRGTVYTCNTDKVIISNTHFEYLDRFQDTAKKEKRRKEKEEAYSSVKTHLRIEDVMKMADLKYNQVYGAIDRGVLKAQIIRHKCYIAPSDAEKFVSRINNERKAKGDKLSVFEVAKRLGKDYLYVLRRVKSGKIPSEHVRGGYLVSWDEAERFFFNEHHEVPKRNTDGKLTATEVAKKHGVSAKSVRKLLKKESSPQTNKEGTTT